MTFEDNEARRGKLDRYIPRPCRRERQVTGRAVTEVYKVKRVGSHFVVSDELCNKGGFFTERELEDVGAIATAKLIGTFASDQFVVASAANKDIFPAFTTDGIIAGAHHKSLSNA